MDHRPETDVRLDVGPDPARATPREIRDETFDIAILGEFSGRPVGESLVPVAVDRDELDAVLAHFAPTMGVGVTGGERLEVEFGALDDFHPDALVQRLPLFRSIRASTSEGRPPTPKAVPPGDSVPRAPVREMLEGSVLDHIVAKDEGEEGRSDPLAKWIEQVVAPHRVDDRGEESSNLHAEVERLVAEGLRALLHAAPFRRLEALWRGVDFLVRRAETDARLRIWLVDVSAEALAADLAEESADGSLLRGLLRRGAGPGGNPWSVLAATWAFGAEPRDLVTLRGIARLCSESGAIFLAGAEAGLAGASELSDLLDRSVAAEPPRLWKAFRREPEARSVGLLIPGVLLRVPYGETTSPCERIEFDEAGSDPGFDAYLWGSPIFAALSLLADAFQAAGTEDLWAAIQLEVGELPLHVRRVEGAAVATPCTEIGLTRHAADRIVEAGLMPLAWLKDSDRVRLLRFQSVASPPSGLALRER